MQEGQIWQQFPSTRKDKFATKESAWRRESRILRENLQCRISGGCAKGRKTSVLLGSFWVGTREHVSMPRFCILQPAKLPTCLCQGHLHQPAKQIAFWEYELVILIESNSDCDLRVSWELKTELGRVVAFVVAKAIVRKCVVITRNENHSKVIRICQVRKEKNIKL